MGRQDSTQANAEHGTHHAPGQEGPRDRGPLLRWKDAQHHSKTDAAIGRFTEADEEARHEHFLIVGGKTAHQGRQAPDRRHENQTADASQAIGDQRQRKGQHTDGNGDDAGKRAKLGIGEAPLGLELRKNHRQHLPRHEVRQQQSEGQGEDHPGVGPCDTSPGVTAYFHWSMQSHGVFPLVTAAFNAQLLK
ncbi:hypothetical protein D9M69_550630 [compost metagenome]